MEPAGQPWRAMTRKTAGARSRDDTPQHHPTRATLIATVLELLETTNPEDVRMDDVLSASGLTSGSLYYHFENFGDLIDQAIITRHSADVDLGVAILAEAIALATDRATLVAGLRAATARAIGAARSTERFHRAQVMARAAANPRFRDALAPHQDRLNDAWADLFRRLQAKGLVDPTVDPLAGGLFAQAYSLGMVLNDVSGHPATEDALVTVVMQVLERSFLVDGPG